MTRWSGIPLTFGQHRCECGSDRLTGTICNSCGRKPDEREVHPSTQARQRAADEARSALDEATAWSGQGSLIEQVSELKVEALVREMFVAAKEVTDGGPASVTHLCVSRSTSVA